MLASHAVNLEYATLHVPELATALVASLTWIIRTSNYQYHYILILTEVRRRGGHLLVAVDSKNRLLARLACLREIHQAVKAGMPMEANFISMQEALVGG